VGTIDQAGSGGSGCESEGRAPAPFLVGGGEAADHRRELHAGRVRVQGGAGYGVDANLLFTWRRQEARSAAVGSGEEPVKLLPVTVAAAGTPAAPAAASEPVGRMDIVLMGGERIIVGADVDASSLARMIKALSRR
jgi:hypothetical protein